MKKIKSTTKRYILSSAVTFVGAFSATLLMQIDSIELSSFSDGAIVAVLFTAIRAGVKALLELTVSKYGKK